MFTPENIAGMILNVIFIACLIALFFFFYATKIEEQIVKDQMAYIVQDFTDSLQVMTTEQKNTLNKSLNQMTLPDLSKQDNEVEQANGDLFQSAMILVGIFVACGLAVVYIMGKYYELDYKTLFKETFIAVFFVGLTEYLFLTYLGTSFRSADPNKVKKTIIDTLNGLK